MKANELRIGNWVLDTMSDEFVQVETITGQQNEKNDDLICFWTKDGGYCEFSLENESEEIEEDKIIKPIPLTEEILLKCGFEMSEHGEYYHKENSDSHDGTMSSKLTHHLTDELFTVVNTSYDGYHIDCKYLHTLQNIWFALTSEELNIEL